MFDYQILLVRKLFVFVFFILSVHTSMGQTCPLNTPEFPFTTDYNDYSWSSGLYFPGQLGGAQTMTSISFRLDNDYSWGSYTYNDIRVYLRHTSVNNFATSPGYPGTAGFTQVYSGNMTFDGTGIYTFNFNVTPSFVYNGSNQLEVLIENRGNTDHTAEEPWFDRTNATAVGIFPGKVGFGGTWGGATSVSSNRRFNLALQFTNPGDICDYPLPVTLISSNLECNGSMSVITWETGSELNNDYFTISYSEDGKNWQFIKRIDGAGNSTENIVYQEVIEREQSGLAYFRLSQTDYDGTTETLNTFTAECSNSSGIKTSPNPVNDVLKLNSTLELTDVKLEIYNLAGEKCPVNYTASTANSGEINMNHLPPGIYTLYVTSNLNREVIKVVKR